MSGITSIDKRSLIATFKLNPKTLQSSKSTKALTESLNVRTRVCLPRAAKAKALEKAAIIDDFEESFTGRKRASKSATKSRPAKKPKFKDDSDDAYIENAGPNIGQPMPDSLLTPERTSVSESSPGEKTFKPKNAGPKAKTPYYTNATKGKPEPAGQPEVWADKRQQLCETLDHYKAYMSGAYYHNKILKGFLIDAKVGEMDVFDHEVIITTAGGGTKTDKHGVQTQSVAEDNQYSAEAAKGSMKAGQAVMLIAGQGNRLSPSKLPHYYNVLGWFQVTDVWRETDKKTYKFRFEKIDLTQKSWWAPQDFYATVDEPLVPQYDALKAMEVRCKACRKSSKHIYNQGWVCLNSDCQQYFLFADVSVDTQSLSYCDTFLKERSPFEGIQPGPLRPALPTQAKADDTNITPYDEAFRRGIVCPWCGCCSRRTDWYLWRCENAACDFEHRLQARIVSVEEAIAEGMSLVRKKLRVIETVRQAQYQVAQYDVLVYILPDQDGNPAGSVYRFRPRPGVKQQADGPDDLFRELQMDNFKLTRNPARNKDKPSEMVTSHFASNFGAIYKYGVTPSTTGFSEAPLAILKALARLRWAGEEAVRLDEKVFVPFNELLLIGYYEIGSMDYHDDGESTLGPTVATLSLGADATMHFRPKKNSGIGASSKNGKGTKPDSLVLTLQHGDLLVMNGTHIHKYYEHSVIPYGKLRFALTSRYVIPEKMMNPEDAEFARVGGTLPEGNEKYTYYGGNDGPASEDV